MNSDQLKASAEKYAFNTITNEPLIKGDGELFTRLPYTAEYRSFLAGAELMRAEITELEHKLSICVGALEFYSKGGNFNLDLWKHEKLGHFTGLRAREALASIQAAPTNPVDETK